MMTLFFVLLVELFLSMIQTIQLNGQDKKLYDLVAPLVMNPEVLRANNNYPFKTNHNFIWFIAIENKEVVGFLPVEQKTRQAIVNNYYVNGRREDVLSKLLQSFINYYRKNEEWKLSSVTLVEDKEMFMQHGFVIEKEWKRYIKMSR